MKKYLLVAFIALSGAVLCFGENTKTACQNACFEKFQIALERHDCLVNECGFSNEEAAAAIAASLSTQNQHQYQKGTLEIKIPANPVGK